MRDSILGWKALQIQLLVENQNWLWLLLASETLSFQWNNSWDIRTGWFWLWSTSSWLTSQPTPPPNVPLPRKSPTLWSGLMKRIGFPWSGRLKRNLTSDAGTLGGGWFAITKTHFDGHMNPPPTCLQPPPLLTCTVSASSHKLLLSRCGDLAKSGRNLADPKTCDYACLYSIRRYYIYIYVCIQVLAL